ncbi:hypothetical protein BOW43_12300 [Solemya velum gill symbiont]|nr:hypothetical protein BOW10_12270 [Solemya velum gill symbiont]OOZ57664.1 hypothetical protein BOW43_12300 [Solemya velum gill symbiont]
MPMNLVQFHLHFHPYQLSMLHQKPHGPCLSPHSFRNTTLIVTRLNRPANDPKLFFDDSIQSANNNSAHSAKLTILLVYKDYDFDKVYLFLVFIFSTILLNAFVIF